MNDEMTIAGKASKQIWPTCKSEVGQGGEQVDSGPPEGCEQVKSGERTVVFGHSAAISRFGSGSRPTAFGRNHVKVRGQGQGQAQRPMSGSGSG
jgi:hypothetical protein|eukprot:2030430-Prymnesium_polylepis.2